ncbi:ABC transporter substrate-binding protein [Hoeflea alexandrii]|uniref:Extracellular solute-binding protein n=1 Tax=Hoeflea alexandrii TaxID=288436 RepID=A0ABT1CLY1_9HYPH|nr:ABC transporter substrate-binding protein [Hoeflea alexandrii]MCO6407216.1 extracellular solute-binding protein [Hoeflea alexandrii]
MNRIIPLSLGLVASLALLASPAVAVDGTLTLYTSQPNTDAQQSVDAFMAAYPDVKVTFVRDGTTKIMAKLEAELAAGSTPADVLLIADSVTMEGLKSRNLLMAYPDADVSAYAEGVHDADKTWFGTKLITTGIMYNTAATMIPSSWSDLLKEEAKGQLAMPSPLTSGAALIHTATLVGNLQAGWGYYEGLAANGAQASGGNGGVLKQVAGGEKLYGMVVDFLPIREKAKGAPVEFVFPAEGVSAISEPVAILASTQNADAAKAFVDFLISKQGQELALSQGYLPAHPDVAVPAGFPDRSTIKVMPFDAAKALAEAEANTARFANIFGQ